MGTATMKQEEETDTRKIPREKYEMWGRKERGDEELKSPPKLNEYRKSTLHSINFLISKPRKIECTGT